MKREGEAEVGSTAEERPVHGEPAVLRRASQLALGCSLLLGLGCPQLLNDDFVDPIGDEVDVGGDAGTSSEMGMGGATGAGGSGANSAGTSSSAGAGGGATLDGAVVISTLPADGSSGVLPDTTLRFMFSAPMDTASVMAAYSSLDLPPERVSFEWSQGDTVLEIQPDEPLLAAAGTDSSAVVATRYAVAVSSEAKDKLGHALVSKQLSFSVARSITQTLKAVQDRDLTGNWRSDSSYGIADCERADTTICAGDGALTAQPDPVYKALITFELSALPSAAIGLTAAELGLVPLNMFGAPFSNLGTLQVERVEFSSIGDAAFAAPALSTRQLMSSGAALGERMAVSVLGDVQADWGARSDNQYRLSFETLTDDDDAPDTLICDWNTAQLSVTYWLP